MRLVDAMGEYLSALRYFVRWLAANGHPAPDIGALSNPVLRRYVQTETAADEGKGQEGAHPLPSCRGTGGAPRMDDLPMVETLADEFEVAQNQPQGTRVRAVERLGA